MTRHLLLLGTHDDTIHSAIFDSDALTLTRGATTSTGSLQPSWLIRHPNPDLKDLVYVNGWDDGKVFVYRKVDDKGGLERLAEASTNGLGPTHLAILEDGSELVIAQYAAGNVVLLPLRADGLFAASEPSPERIFTPPFVPLKHHRHEHAHVHQIVLHGDEILAPDLGSNKVWRLKWDGKRISLLGQIDGLEDGDGPRHVVVHPNGSHIYILNEISSVLTVHTLPAEGPSSLVKRFSLLPAGDDGAPRQTGASEIILLPPTRPDGPLLLIASNRDSPVSPTDTLALFSVSSTDGADVQWTKEGWIGGIGRHLRGVGADASGRWVAVLGRDGGGLKMFERVGEDGLELREVARLKEIENAVVPLWV
ncbi:hypothetical protein IAT38_001182 [Cryptococcus sp. DSM 104549]